ncbi:unnamed protein product [marine sediment metagenome]|uniref:Uncharacterized protein n=1 Tax=marine sediment metagenome TaxID=412755 RepID=X1DDL4_9ZZZZ
MATNIRELNIFFDKANIEKNNPAIRMPNVIDFPAGTLLPKRPKRKAPISIPTDNDAIIKPSPRGPAFKFPLIV